MTEDNKREIINYRVKNLETDLIKLEEYKSHINDTLICIDRGSNHGDDDLFYIEDNLNSRVLDFIISEYKELIKIAKRS